MTPAPAASLTCPQSAGGPPRIPRAVAALALVAAAVLAGCASGPRGGRDGPGDNPPEDLARVPDAVPRVEPLRRGGPNKPYVVLGRRYVPLTGDEPLHEEGLASWYGRKFHGRPTAMGETYDMYAMTAAHKTMPLPSYARVRNPANGREVIVRVNDRGPFHDGRVIDLSYTAALKLGVLGGVAPVVVDRLTFDEIRAGAGRPRAPDDGGPPVDLAGWWLQLGAFRDREGAAQLQRLIVREAPWLAPRLELVEDAGASARGQAGPFATRDDADDAARRLADALPLRALVQQRP